MILYYYKSIKNLQVKMKKILCISVAVGPIARHHAKKSDAVV